MKGQNQNNCNCGHDHVQGKHTPEHSHDHGQEHSQEHSHPPLEHSHGHQHESACTCGHEHSHNHEQTHDHSHGDSCGCRHEHHHDDSCGCGHEHSHEGDSHSGAESSYAEPQPEELYVSSYHVPGHPKDCQCERCHPHAQYCDVCGESLANCICRMPDDGVEKHVYILENLGCANCAAKMETKIRELPAVKYATITYATKQLRVAADDHKTLLPVFQEICASIEPDVKVMPRRRSPGPVRTVIFTVENLDCANCGAKIERRMNEELGSLAKVTLTYATKQLRVTGASPERLLPKLQEICSALEPDVRIVPKETTSGKTEDPSAAKPKKKLSENAKSGIGIGIGAVLFIAGEIAHDMNPLVSTIVFLAAYAVLGWEIVRTALKNLRRGQIFDENFLMSLATIAAICIQDYAEAVGVMLFYRIGELFEAIAVERSRSQIMDAVDMRPETVNLVIGEEVRVIPAGEAQIGDILLVRPGDRIPLDGVVLEGESRIDTSPVTGEPVPVKAGFGDAVTSGCVNTSGLLKIRVEKILEESMVTRILDSVENAAASKPKIDRFITKFARIYTPFVVILALGTAVIPSLITGDWHHWIYTAVTFLVISCPCALVLSVPLSFFSGIGAGSKRGILFKGGASLEVLKNIKAVVMDKTGTITKGNFVVQKCVPEEGTSEKELLTLAASCELTSTHPIGSSIITAAREQNLDIRRPSDVKEISGKGIKALLPEGEVLCGNRRLMEMFHIDIPNCWNTGYGTEVLTALNGKFIGRLVIADTLKEDAAPAISALKKSGIITAMLTGDAEESAKAVADAAGIDEVHARLLPQDKVNELQKIRSSHGSVMFVGDGINDAPVLAGADVGAAMGSGADAAIEAADVVFMTSSMEAIPQAISIARSTGRIAMQNVVFALIIKALVMVLGLAGFANMWMAVFADTGVAMICVLNSIRVLYKK